MTCILIKKEKCGHRYAQGRTLCEDVVRDQGDMATSQGATGCQQGPETRREAWSTLALTAPQVEPTWLTPRSQISSLLNYETIKLCVFFFYSRLPNSLKKHTYTSALIHPFSAISKTCDKMIYQTEMATLMSLSGLKQMASAYIPIPLNETATSEPRSLRNTNTSQRTSRS